MTEKKVTTKIGEVTIPEPPKNKPKPVAPVAVKPLQSEKCRICGKPMTRADSIAAGMGHICQQRIMQLGGMTLQEHRQSITVQEVPADYIPLRKALDAASAIGISNHRFGKAIGGDRAIGKPLHPSFKIVYFQGKRYLSKECLQHLEEARLK